MRAGPVENCGRALCHRRFCARPVSQVTSGTLAAAQIEDSRGACGTPVLFTLSTQGNHMSKLIKSLALGTAAAAVVAVSSAAYAFCPREGGYYQISGYYNDYKGGHYENDYYGYKKPYSEKTEYGAYDKPDADEDDDGPEDVEEVVEFRGPEFTKGPGKLEAPEDRDEVVEKEAPEKVVEQADADDDEKDEAESALYEITAKSGCDGTGCSAMTLRDGDGEEIEVRGISFADELTKGASREEVAYQLFQNGSVVRGRLVEIEGDEDESAYDFVVERIYS